MRTSWSSTASSTSRSAAIAASTAPGGVGLREQRLAPDLADPLLAGLDDRVRPDHLQVEDEPTGIHRVDHVAQDVHDVLRFDSSERPGEEREVERTPLDLDLRTGCNAIV
ncbi:MAG: hypothetical protein ACXVRI_01420, partial [Gaiellaceae bacterium]